MDEITPELAVKYLNHAARYDYNVPEEQVQIRKIARLIQAQQRTIEQLSDVLTTFQKQQPSVLDAATKAVEEIFTCSADVGISVTPRKVAYASLRCAYEAIGKVEKERENAE